MCPFAAGEEDFVMLGAVGVIFIRSPASPKFPFP